MKLIVGLGNPGTQYEATRHNAGAWFVESLLTDSHSPLRLEKKLHGKLAQFEHDGMLCKAFIPTTFMNLSGHAVRAVSQFYRLHASDILVVHDELDFQPGRVKLKLGGGHAGHNGLRDIIQQLGTRDFYRLRIGIGHPGDKSQVSDYVLSSPSKQDKTAIDTSIANALSHLPHLLAGECDVNLNSE